MEQLLKKKKEQAKAAKRNEVAIDQILDRVDSDQRPGNPATDANKPKVADDRWIEEADDTPEDNYKATTDDQNKRRVPKKKQQAAAWESVPQDKEPVIEEPKEEAPAPKQKGTWRKPNELRQKEQEAKFENLEEEFPDLNAVDTVKKTKSKPKPQPQETQPVSTSPTTTSTGPRKFVNTKKTTGEAFKPLEQISEKQLSADAEEPKAAEHKSELITKTQSEPARIHHDKPVTGIARSEMTRSEFTRQKSPPKTETKEEAAADTKFKFGGEGPKRFIGVKKTESTHKEEIKTEADLKREEAERRAEEAIEREKHAHAAEKPKFGFSNKKPIEHPTAKPEDKPATTDATNGEANGMHTVEHKLQKKHSKPREGEERRHRAENGDHPRGKRSPKKDKDAPKEKEHVKEAPVKEQPKIIEASEPKKVVAQANLVGWGEAPMIKKKPVA